MQESEKIAIAAHLHVLLRRKTGRVTDTEWMAYNREYGREIVRFARQRAVEDNAPELAQWAQRLEDCFSPEASSPPQRGLMGATAQALRPQPAPPSSAAPVAPPRYVGGIR